MAANIRRAELSDAAALGELHAFCWRELYSSLLPAEMIAKLNAEMMAGLWQKFMTRGEVYKQWVAEVNGDVIAFAGVGPGREPGFEHTTELYFVYVAPAVRKAGVGTALLEAADPDYMWIWEAHKSTLKFYKKKKYSPDMVRGVRGTAARSRIGMLFGSYLTELRMTR